MRREERFIKAQKAFEIKKSVILNNNRLFFLAKSNSRYCGAIHFVAFFKVKVLLKFDK